jgi:hypothetical protein
MSSITRKDEEFAKILETSGNNSIGYGKYPPLEMLKLLLGQYSKQKIEKSDLTNEIRLLLNDHPEELDNFRKEMNKYKLKLALKNNFMEKSPQYTIRPFQKPTRKTASTRKSKLGTQKSVKRRTKSNK